MLSINNHLLQIYQAVISFAQVFKYLNLYQASKD